MRSRGSPTRSFAGLVVCSLFACALPAAAGDGRREINQASVLASDGFPFVISQSGSYVLTGDLTVADADTAAIVIDASDVSIDLAGFALRGPVVCTGGGGGAVSCAPSPGGGTQPGTASGVFLDLASAREGIAIRNGSVRGFGGHGIYLLGVGAVVQDVRVESNHDGGIVIGPGIVTGCTARLNGGDGINSAAIGVSGAALVRGNAARDNAGAGIDGALGSALIGNTATDNAGAGIQGGATLVSGNGVHGNGGHGIDVVSPSSATLVSGNAIESNGGDGIRAGPLTGFAGNVIANHPGNVPVSGGAIYLYRNLCDGSTDGSVCDGP